jgi:hypothetical protein
MALWLRQSSNELAIVRAGGTRDGIFNVVFRNWHAGFLNHMMWLMPPARTTEGLQAITCRIMNVDNVEGVNALLEYKYIILKN